MVLKDLGYLSGTLQCGRSVEIHGVQVDDDASHP